MPPAMSSVAGVPWCSAVKAPYGPSTRTRDPTRTWRSPALVAPTAFAVRRRVCPSGAADSENGFACHQPKCPGNRQMQNWPARAGKRSRSRPVTWIETTSSDSGTTSATRKRWRRLRRTGTTARNTRSEPMTRAHMVHQ